MPRKATIHFYSVERDAARADQAAARAAFGTALVAANRHAPRNGYIEWGQTYYRVRHLQATAAEGLPTLQVGDLWKVRDRANLPALVRIDTDQEFDAERAGYHFVERTAFAYQASTGILAIHKNPAGAGIVALCGIANRFIEGEDVFAAPAMTAAAATRFMNNAPDVRVIEFRLGRIDRMEGLEALAPEGPVRQFIDATRALNVPTFSARLSMGRLGDPIQRGGAIEAIRSLLTFRPARRSSPGLKQLKVTMDDDDRSVLDLLSEVMKESVPLAPDNPSSYASRARALLTAWARRRAEIELLRNG